MRIGFNDIRMCYINLSNLLHFQRAIILRYTCKCQIHTKQTHGKGLHSHVIKGKEEKKKQNEKKIRDYVQYHNVIRAVRVRT